MQKHEKKTKRGRWTKLLKMLIKAVISGQVGNITSGGLSDEDEEVERKRRQERNRSEVDKERDMAK